MNPYLRLIRFDKPVGTWLLMYPTLWALLLAGNGKLHFGISLAFLLGVFLARSAGCAINDFADADFDSKVERTKNRPLATGEISKKSALLFCAILCIAAFLIALVFLQVKTLYYSVPALFLLASYPFTKRFLPLPQAYLSIAFSFGIIMAFIELQNKVSFLAILLFLANVFWVIAYDTIYAMVDYNDDIKIGIKTSAITFGKNVVVIVMSLYGLSVITLLLCGFMAHLSMWFYLGLLVYILQVIYIYTQIKDKQREKCFKAFLYNNKIGIVLSLAIALGLWY